MKILSVIRKSLIEQLRSFWILILTISMAPFFVFVYYLILESYKPQYNLLLLNQDKGIEDFSHETNYGNFLVLAAKSVEQSKIDIPLRVKKIEERIEGMNLLKNRKADALIIIPEDFSECLHNLINKDEIKSIEIEFIGDLTNINYLVSAVWADEILNDYLAQITQRTKLVKVKETSLGLSGKIDEFDLYVPGLLILSIIMLMFSATIAIINEVENKTIIRLKLSKVTAFELLTGISTVQVLVGITAVMLTLIVAVWLGFEINGAFAILILISILTSISIIAFSLIIAAITKTANEVLIVGNFPLLLFMFFSGAAFPIKGKELFSIAGYPITIQGFMSPTHAITALKKVLIMNMTLTDIIPEILILVALIIIYFLIGVWLFQLRHMKIV